MKVANLDTLAVYGLGGKWYQGTNNSDYELQSLYESSDGINSAESCCTRAFATSNTIFYQWNSGTCNIYVGKNCPAVNFNGTKVDVDVYYEPIKDRPDWYSSFAVGNGACGNVKLQSLWED